MMPAPGACERLPIGVVRLLAVAALRKGLGLDEYMSRVGFNHAAGWTYHALEIAEREFVAEYHDYRNTGGKPLGRPKKHSRRTAAYAVSGHSVLEMHSELALPCQPPRRGGASAK